MTVHQNTKQFGKTFGRRRGEIGGWVRHEKRREERARNIHVLSQDIPEQWHTILGWYTETKQG